MTFGAAQRRGEAADSARVEQRRVRRRQFLRDDDAAFGHLREGLELALHQHPDQPAADFPHIGNSRRDVGVVHLGEAVGQRRDFRLNRTFRIDPVGDDPPLHPTG